jgi:1-acyl-sn-glycerol-3-phosphate acyltransferase
MHRLLAPLVWIPARRLGRIAARADGEARLTGLSGASRLILPDLAIVSTARGTEKIPRSGPLLIVSNHPGGFDSLAVLASIPRKDLKVAISDVPLTRAFVNARHYYVYVPDVSAGRAAALRESIEHLKSGGALLVFPHGEVEPDPELGPGYGDAVQDWSRSIEIMLRHVPECWLQVTIVSGAILPKFLRSPLARIRKSAPARQKLAEVLQISRQMVSQRGVRVHIHISFADPIRGMDIKGDALMSTVAGMARQLLADHMAQLGIPGRCR